MAIWSTYSETGKAMHPRKRGLPKEAGVKVDVVADGGRQWIRVNTCVHHVLSGLSVLFDHARHSRQDKELSYVGGVPRDRFILDGL